MSRSRKRKSRRKAKPDARPDIDLKGPPPSPEPPTPQRSAPEELTPPDPPLSPTPPLWRRSPVLFTLVSTLLAAQVWLPLSYYLGDYPWDERFSWRMFSTVRGLNCQARAWEGAEGRAAPCPNGEGRCTQLRLSRELHMVWVNLLKRGRREVLSHFVKRRCERVNRPLYVSLTCPAPEAPHPMITVQSPDRDLCAHPEALFDALRGGER